MRGVERTCPNIPASGPAFHRMTMGFLAFVLLCGLRFSLIGIFIQRVFAGPRRRVYSICFPSGVSAIVNRLYMFKITKIGHVGFWTKDLARMEDFYTRVLGFKVTSRSGPGAKVPGGASVFLRCDVTHHEVVFF